jgi:hypothetical protein
MSARKGPLPWKGKRQKVTLNVDTKAYRAIRVVVDKLPGVSVSDVVSELLLAVSDDLVPLAERIAAAKNHTQRLAVLEEHYKNTSGQYALEFVRAYAAVEAAGKELEEG